MKVRLEQLNDHLRKTLAPLYVVYGDEPLLVQEACDVIRGAARGQGYDERLVMEADAGFDWESLRHASDNLSLFTQRRLVELRLYNGKAGAAGGRALTDYAARPAADTVLLVVAGKLEGPASQRPEWLKALEHHGVAIQVWPVKHDRLPAWIAARMRDRGMQADAAAVSLIAARTEGNLLASVQEIEKLSLLYGQGRLGAREAVAAVTESARFNLYDLVDGALAGDVPRVVRIVDGLRAEGAAPALVLWALAQEIRRLYGMTRDRDQEGMSIDQVLTRYKAWDSRKALARGCLTRYSLHKWRRLTHEAARVDRTLKGMEEGDAWDELLKLSVSMAGAELGLEAACG